MGLNNRQFYSAASEAQFAPDGIEPTLDDEAVLAFCKTGVLGLPGIVPEATNGYLVDLLSDHAQGIGLNEQRPGIGRAVGSLADDPRFMEGVLLHPQVAGAARSLLGAGFKLPRYFTDHRLEGEAPALPWHIDAGSRFERNCTILQLFYCPQANNEAMAPTMFLPGSHLVPVAREMLEHFGSLADEMMTVGPAGTVWITAFSCWHRQPRKTAPGDRHLIKWQFWRTAAPRRDWLPTPGFDAANADYSAETDFFTGPVHRWQTVPRVAEMFYWLRGEHHAYAAASANGSGFPYSREGAPATGAKESTDG